MIKQPSGARVRVYTPLHISSASDTASQLGLGLLAWKRRIARGDLPPWEGEGGELPPPMKFRSATSRRDSYDSAHRSDSEAAVTPATPRVPVPLVSGPRAAHDDDQRTRVARSWHDTPFHP